jgi:hypothetical protein
VIGVHRRVVVHDGDRLENPRVADQLGQLRSLVRPMEARGDEHRDS